jgi:arylesterase/paraoxonase
MLTYVPMKRTAFLILSLLLAAALSVTLGILRPAGVFRDIVPHFGGAATLVPLPIAGPEDIAADSAADLAFISVDDRRTGRATPGSTRGGILLYRQLSDTPFLRDVTPSGMDDFHPHGISLWRSADNRILLFVISHRQRDTSHAVERFEWRNDSLVHLESIVDAQRMTSPNDIAAVGERSFYVTNDHYYPLPGPARTLEDYLQRAISYVNYFDGRTFRTVAEGIAYANGVNLSPDGNTVYVAATTGRKLLSYARDRTDGSLQLLSETPLETGVDNIEVDARGDLWIGCHPQLLRFVAHGRDSAEKSPSQILRLRPLAGGGFETNEVFLNDGRQYSDSTVAVPFRGLLLTGSVFEPALLVLQPTIRD